MARPLVGGNGRCAALFLWLAARFLANDDSVLNCESVHAQWQWYMKAARSCKLKNVNATLIVRSWAKMFGELPPRGVATRIHGTYRGGRPSANVDRGR